MKVTDIKDFNGQLKSALAMWAESKIDELLPNKATVRAMMKAGARNMLERYGAEVDKATDMLGMFLPEDITADGMVEMVASLLEEMDVKEISRGLVGVTAGRGEVRIELPRNFLTEMLNVGVVKFNKEDILQLKDFFKKDERTDNEPVGAGRP